MPTSSSINEITEEIVEVMVGSKDGEEGSSDKPITGKNVLVVDDDRTLHMLSTAILHKLRATLHVSENGKEAFDLVCTNLKNKEQGSLPFDYIFVDCKVRFTFHYLFLERSNSLSCICVYIHVYNVW